LNCLKDHSRVLGSHGIQQFRIVLADEGLLVVAGDVVPDHPVVVEVVQHAQAPLVVFTLKREVMSLASNVQFRVTRRLVKKIAIFLKK